MEVLPVAFDDVTAADALDAALRLTHVVDAGALIADDSDLPRSVSQLSLFPTDPLTEIGTIIERWQQSQSILTGPFAPSEPIRKAGNLRALVGQSPIGPHYLDLRADGPHALVGGMTGSGKSEFLQSWILALAATHSPQRLNFLLVDYKGGAAFADCDRLPHSTGLVTDLSPHMVRRALTSLSAELKFREEFLRDHDAKDLQALEAQGHEDAPPSLVVVIDEFAKLKEDVPEFFEGMIDVAQRGRSLGVHLIMATQRPAGVITGSLRANTNLRLALRLADEADSTDILGTPVAATFDADTPGRAVSKSGPGRLVPFQAAYAGGWTTDERDAPEILVQELTLLAPATWESPAGEPVVRDKNATDIKRLVQTIIDADAMAALPEPKRAWQPVLAPTSSLEHLHLGGSDSSLAIGQADDPEHQDRPVVHFVPDRDGSMVVYGTGGAGKSTFLRSIAVASGLTTHDGPCHVYGLDFGSRGLSMLEVLPHVGSVINGSDHERVIRLLGWLRTEVEERARRYSPYNVGSITQYRVQSKNADEPRIILLLDGIAAFRAAYDSTDRIRWVDALGTIASEGRPVGVHVVMSSETRSGLTTALASSVQRRLVLRLAAEEEYGMLGVESDVLSAKSPPGRGLLDGLEVQVAVLGGSADPVLQAAEVENLARAMREANRSEAPPIRRLPELVAFDTLPIPLEGIPVGIASDDLDVFSVSPRGAFLLSGSAGSGRSTALEVLAASFRRSHPCGELHYLGLRRSAAAQAPWWTSVAFGVDEIQQRALELAKRLDAGEGPRVAVFLEAAGDQVSGPAEQALQQLVRACTTEEHWFVAEGEMSTLINQSGFLGQVKAARSGLILQPDPDSGQTLLRTPYPRVNRSDFPPGRGIYISRGHVRIVQVAMPDLIAVGPDG
jgi:S-DNA-T family DNA segregation ATPase FtsK/SpoIIIE